jgi:hypothetical protein
MSCSVLFPSLLCLSFFHLASFFYLTSTRIRGLCTSVYTCTSGLLLRVFFTVGLRHVMHSVFVYLTYLHNLAGNNK